MQKRMIAFLHSIDPLLASWVLVDENNHIIQSIAQQPLTIDSGISETFVLVPAQDVLLTQTHLPKLNRQRLLQALPFALEEQLLDDVENLHFAIGPFQPNDQAPVAIVSKQKIAAWLAALKTVGISPSTLIPSTFALSIKENAWHINTYEHHCIVRTGQYTGFACEQDNLPTLIDLNFHGQKINKDTIEMVTTELTEIQLIENNLSQILAPPPINLLQGSFQSKRKATHAKKIWKLAIYLVATWVALTFVENLISIFILQHQLSKIDSAMNTIYHRNFPQATSMVAPKQRMEEKLKTIFNTANKNNLLALLSLVAQNSPEKNAVHFQNVEFREKQLTIEVSAASFENLDAFANKLSEQGLQVKRQNAATTGTQVKASFQITAGDA